MYTLFYNLNKNPFEMNPDVSFLWFGDEQRNAFSTLRYGIQENKGFLLLTGAPGSGKTTLINLLPRFFEATSGNILIDGMDITQLSLHSLRDKMGIVTQENILFNDTVRNNIAFFRGFYHLTHQTQLTVLFSPQH